MDYDPADYRQYMIGFNMSEAEMDEVTYIVWRVMESAVDRAWNADPVQLVLEDRDNNSSKDGMDSACMIELESHEYRYLSKAFNEKKGDHSE